MLVKALAYSEVSGRLLLAEALTISHRPRIMRAHAAGLTDVGLQRDHNEDSFAIAPEFNLFIVADGMGGHRAGDVASKMATDSITEFFRSTSREDATWPFHFDTNLSEEENRLVAGIRLANRQIFDKGIRSRDHS